MDFQRQEVSLLREEVFASIRPLPDGEGRLGGGGAVGGG